MTETQAIAIVGMACSLPGASDVQSFWELLSSDRCGLTNLDDTPVERWREQGYVPVRGRLDGVFDFDPEHFGYTEQDARYLDPQVRLMLLQVHRALHDAHIAAPTRVGLDAALFASLSQSTYRQYLQPGDLEVPFTEDYCSEDLAPLRIAHKLNLTGPSMRVQSTCSSSLLGLHLACQALRRQECGVAIVAAASVTFPQETGYAWIEGGIHSPTGRCRPFDEAADGTVGGDGCAAVVLKRLDDALRDGDRVYATVLGSAVNNDGGDRIGFTAPGIGGHIQVVRKALREARVPASWVGLVEAHGTGTSLGDPIEFAALSEAYGESAQLGSICLSGVKGHIGHTDVVAGLAGVIKCVLAMSHRMYLPIHGHTRPNSALDVANSPFFFVGSAKAWPQGDHPRIAGISSLGMGGTNVHCLLQEAPPEAEASFPRELLAAVPIGASSPEALEELCDSLHRHLSQVASATLPQIALAAARIYAAQPVRFAMVARDREDFLRSLASRDTRHVSQPRAPSVGVGMAYVFPGAEVLPAAVVQDVVRAVPALGPSLNRIHEWFAREQQIFVYPELFPGPGPTSPFAQLLQEHARVYGFQIGLFELCRNAGMAPAALLGYSLGEFAAAVCAGVLAEPLANQLLTLRSRALANSGLSGWMLAVLCNEAELPAALRQYRAGKVSSELCMLAGPKAESEAVCELLDKHELMYRRVGGDHGLHSGALLKPPSGLGLRPQPTRATDRWPLFSSFLGSRVGDEAPLSTVAYWLRQCMEPIQFDAAMNDLLSSLEPAGMLQLSGSGNLAQIAMGSLLRHHDAPPWLASLSRCSHVLLETSQARDEGSAGALMATFARVWNDGAPLLWEPLLPLASPPLPALPMQPMNLRSYRLDAAVGAETRLADRSTGTTVPELRRVVHDSDAATNDAILLALSDEFVRAFGERGRSPDADFFQLGGHSLLAIQLLYRVHARSGVRIPVRDLLLYPTPAALAARYSECPAPTCATQPFVDDTRLSTVWQRAHDWSREITLAADARNVSFREFIAAEVADLIAQARNVFGVRLYPHELLPLVAADELAQLVDRACRESSLASTGPQSPSQPARARQRPTEERDRDALVSAFILSSARSGSTLLRVMMAGNPGLFCPPELHMLMFGDLKERKEKIGSSHFANGLVRAFQELQGVSWEEARQYTTAMERDKISVREAYRRLTSLCGGRLLVDKSPSYAEQYSHLARIDEVFDHSYTIFLVRHPLAVIESYVRNRIGSMSAKYGSAPLHVLGEEHWLSTNLNIRRWLASGRRPHLFLRYEDLVMRPEIEMRVVSRALGLPYNEAMVKPYEGQRMLDGVGDPGIHEHDSIETEFAHRWRSRTGGIKLAAETRVLAEEFGYVI